MEICRTPFPLFKNYYLALTLIKSNRPMISTLKKIEHIGTNRTGICISYSNVHNLHHSFASNLIEAGTDNPLHPATAWPLKY